MLEEGTVEYQFEITRPDRDTWFVPARKVVLDNGDVTYEPTVPTFVGRGGVARLVKKEDAQCQNSDSRPSSKP